MLVSQIIAAVNSLGDDQLDDNTVMSWLNDAIAEINKECECELPFFTAVTETPVIPETWQRMLLIPYGVARMKQQDSSKFEYDDSYAQFFNNLGGFSAQYEVPKQYKYLVVGSEINLPNGDYATIEYGDTLEKIATQFTTTVQAILDANTNEEIKYQGNGYESNVYSKPMYPHMGGW